MKSDEITKSLVWAANSFLLDALFDQSPLGLAVVNEKFTFIKVSKYCALHIHSHPVEEILGKTILQVLGKENWKKVKQYYERALAGEYIHDVHVIYTFGSTTNERHFLLTLYPLPPLQEGKLIGVLLQEVTRQYQTEKDLMISQNRLEMAQNAGGIGIFEWNLATNEVWISPVEQKLFDLPISEKTIEGERFLSNIHPDDKKQILSSIKEKAKERKDFDMEFRLFFSDKETMWVRGKGKYIYNKRGEPTHLIGVNYDITSRKKEEEFLKFKADTSRLLNSSLNYPKVIQQVCDLAVKYVADWCSIDILEDSSFKMMAISHKDPKKVKFAKKLREKYPATLESNKGLAQVVASNKPLFIPHFTEEMIRDPSLTLEQQKILEKLNLSSLIIVPLVFQGRAIGGMTFVLAESREKYTENELEMAQQLGLRASLYLENAQLYSQIKTERQRLIKLLEDVPCVVWETKNPPNDPRSQTIFINAYAQKLLGYPLKKWLTIPQFSRKITHPEDQTKVQQEVERVFLTGKPGQVRFRWLQKSGKYIWVESRFNPIYDQKNSVIGLRGVSTDISERMKLEQRKDEFIATASHELKTPLTSLKVFTQVIKANNTLNPSPKLTQYLSRMEREVDRLTELVFDLLDISRIQSGQLVLNKEKVCLTELLTDVIQSVQTTINHKVIFTQKTSLIVEADRHRLSQVFVNLISNAAKYSPQANEIIIKMKKEKGKVVIQVQDFGIGIENEYQEHIFERFYRVFDEKDKTFPGLGMGLFISKNIIERHNGQLWVQSKPQHGSTFFVSLPIGHSVRRKDEKGNHY